MQAAPPSPALGAGVCFETVAPAPSERRHVPQSGTRVREYPCVFVIWNNFRGFYLHYRVIILHFTLIGRMWVRPSIEC